MVIMSHLTKQLEKSSQIKDHSTLETLCLQRKKNIFLIHKNCPKVHIIMLHILYHYENLPML